MILVTGASGSMGRAVALELSGRGVAYSAMYRNQKDAASIPKGGTAVIADFADKSSLARALAGIDVVYLVCSPIPALVELEGNMIDACALAGIKHIVLNSALGAGDYSKSFPSWHRAVEDKLKSSGIGFTILRPNSFLQNILAYQAPGIRAQNTFYSAMTDAKTSYLDVRDIAAVAVNALLDPKSHAGQTYELNGPEAVTSDQLAQRISTVAGRPIAYVAIPESAQQKAMLDMGMPAWQVTAILELQQYYTCGQGGEVTDVLPRLLGREPIRLDAFLTEFKSSFEPLNPKTGMTHSEMKQFVRNHFEEFVNRKNLGIADVNFAPGFADHGSDVPPGTPPGPAGAKSYVGGAYKLFPDIRVEILDLIAENDKVVVRNHWTGTQASSGTKLEFSGIVIWRIENRQLIERWAYLTPPHPVKP
jgi:uncharacterized protein YbjT (DUF2867 family)/predicted SnoaL-like aldol condensation-catalyzing enzyme